LTAKAQGKRLTVEIQIAQIHRSKHGYRRAYRPFPPFDDLLEVRVLHKTLAEHSIERGMIEQITQPICHCIYCGRMPPAVLLEKEHVIPDGLGGDMVLADASCRSCGHVTSRHETHLMRVLFGDVRAIQGLRSRKRQGKKTQTRGTWDFYEGGLEELRSGRGTKNSIQADNTMPFSVPQLITGRLPRLLTKEPQFELSEHNIMVVHRQGLGEPGTGTIPYPYYQNKNVHFGHIAKAICKIAHCFTFVGLANAGLKGFRPILPSYIINPDPFFDTNLIGSFMNEAYGDDIHQVYLDEVYPDYPLITGRRFYVVRLRLFSNFPSATYFIVTGTPLTIA
jgi:hypothetical protein